MSDFTPTVYILYTLLRQNWHVSLGVRLAKSGTLNFNGAVEINVPNWHKTGQTGTRTGTVVFLLKTTVPGLPSTCQTGTVVFQGKSVFRAFPFQINGAKSRATLRVRSVAPLIPRPGEDAFATSASSEVPFPRRCWEVVSVG